MQSVTVAYVGMTHLGIHSAVAAAEKGFQTVCFDPNKELIVHLKQGQLAVVEPFLLEFVHKNSKRLHFTSDLSDLKQCDLVYIAPDVVTNDLGQSDLSYIRMLIDLVNSCIDLSAIMVILSQIPPGFTRNIQRDLTRTFYQVETLIFGQAVQRALQPERLIIGAENPKLSLPEQLTIFLESFNCPIIPMQYESAELSKIAINMFLVSSICTSNTIAEMCEKIGADWAEITPSLQMDKRIGKHAYLSPGLGIAGGNLERDIMTFCSLADLHGIDSSIVHAWQKHVSYRRNWILRKIHSTGLVGTGATFSMLGIAYKKNTASIKNAPALDVLSFLTGDPIRVFDPVVKLLPDRYPNIEVVASSMESYRDADVLLIMTPWDEFRNLSLKDIKKQMRGNMIIDPFGVLDRAICNEMGLSYHRLGV